jgi:hypothetical protein
MDDLLKTVAGLLVVLNALPSHVKKTTQPKAAYRL